MKLPKFKRGDWVFFDYTLHQIKETEEDRITDVTDGHLSHGGNDLSDRCFPLDLRIKRISDSVNYWSKEFLNLKNSSLNYPGLINHLTDRWVQMCNEPDDTILQKHHKNLSEFGNSVLGSVRNMTSQEVNGINLFRR